MIKGRNLIIIKNLIVSKYIEGSYLGDVMFYLTFVLFSLIDLICTIKLYSVDGLEEMNPVADWFLVSYGPMGLMVFKFTLVLIVLTCTFLVGRKKTNIERCLLTLANVSMLMVSAYQFFLMNLINVV